MAFKLDHDLLDAFNKKILEGVQKGEIPVNEAAADYAHVIAQMEKEGPEMVNIYMKAHISE